MPSLVNVNEVTFSEEVLESNQPVLVDFWAPWCQYCSRLMPVLDELAAEISDRVKIVKLNVEESRSLTQKYVIRNLPTMVLFKNGEPVEKIVGFKTKAEILQKILK